VEILQGSPEVPSGKADCAVLPDILDGRLQVRPEEVPDLPEIRRAAQGSRKMSRKHVIWMGCLVAFVVLVVIVELFGIHPVCMSSDGCL
jgi:hypothetical protein